VPALAVVFTPRAARQVEAAFSWWAENRRAAPDALREDLAAALALVASQPTMGLPIAGMHRGVRRVHLPRVGYHLYYRVAPRLAQLQVLAFWHARRGSSPT
jgi:plasmid stabilization system protein ParE